MAQTSKDNACPSYHCRTEGQMNEDRSHCSACGLTFTEMDIELDDELEEYIAETLKDRPGWTEEQVLSELISRAVEHLKEKSSNEG